MHRWRSNKRVTIMSHAEQLERETERTRTQIANTLDELRTCMTPGHVLDQLADRVSDGAAAAFRAKPQAPDRQQSTPSHAHWCRLGMAYVGSPRAFSGGLHAQHCRPPAQCYKRGCG